MDKRIADSLANRPDSYILPFFWQHGESHAILIEEIIAIQNSGIREFCVESRTHEEFGREAWWTDFRFILDQARERGMRVWLLDDKCFPTGYANGRLTTGAGYEHLRKKVLRHHYIDVLGPVPQAAILVNDYLRAGEDLLLAVAYRRSGKDCELVGDPLPLGAPSPDGFIYLDIPDGVWRIFFLVRTGQVNDCMKNFIDILSPESCRLMLDAVYEPHYQHFAEYFGNTFAGFYSDEPNFGNTAWTYQSRVGAEDLLAPWRDDLPDLIAAETGLRPDEVLSRLPALWQDLKDWKSLIRTAYMNVVTRLYQENFSWLLGDWCRDHGILYIGHIIEDMNCHMRLGYGSGHYFRALIGQDMAGIDVVMQQIIPGLSEMKHAYLPIESPGDPEFFTYTLAKLASSQAHIQPLKQGRAFCEVFGGYGWAEGLSMMKHLIDLLTAQGINHYVPHAFDPKYPDLDGPPHFYARGGNPQYPLFGDLMRYTQRICHVLSGGCHQASVAVYYNAESEWSGGKYSLFQGVAKTLLQQQIDFDFIPADTLYSEEAAVAGNKLLVNGEAYQALIVSYSQILPRQLLNRFHDLAVQGLDVIFIDGLPEQSCENKDLSEINAAFRVLPLDRLTDELHRNGQDDLRFDDPCPRLFAYHIKRGSTHIYLFYNNDLSHAVNTWFRPKHPIGSEFLVYQAWENKIFRAGTRGGKLPLVLEGGDSVIYVVDAAEVRPDSRIDPYVLPGTNRRQLDLRFDISLKAAGEPAYQPYRRQSGLINLTGRDNRPNFKGHMLYKTELAIADPSAYAFLDLGFVGETASLSINGQYLGSRIAGPYRFALGHSLSSGLNQIQIEVVNNPAYFEKDKLSKFLPLPPSGILGPITLMGAQEE